MLLEVSVALVTADVELGIWPPEDAILEAELVWLVIEFVFVLTFKLLLCDDDEFDVLVKEEEENDTESDEVEVVLFVVDVDVFLVLDWLGKLESRLRKVDTIEELINDCKALGEEEISLRI